MWGLFIVAQIDADFSPSRTSVPDPSAIHKVTALIAPSTLTSFAHHSRGGVIISVPDLTSSHLFDVGKTFDGKLRKIEGKVSAELTIRSISVSSG